jgi:hypothetical protein
MNTTEWRRTVNCPNCHGPISMMALGDPKAMEEMLKKAIKIAELLQALAYKNLNKEEFLPGDMRVLKGCGRKLDCLRDDFSLFNTIGPNAIWHEEACMMCGRKSEEVQHDTP